MASASPLRRFSSSPKKQGSTSAFALTLAVLAILVLALVGISHVWADVRWYSQLHAGQVFWKQLGWSIVLGAFGTLLVAASALINILLPLRKEAKNATSRPRTPRLLVWSAAIAAGIFFGGPLASQWRMYLTWVHRTDFGNQDAQFGHDVGFYVFTLPVLHSLVGVGFAMLLVGFVAALIGHFLADGLHFSPQGVKLSRGFKRHVAILAAIACLLGGMELFLSRYDMLLSNNGKFSGASFADINASLPGRTVLSIVAVLVAVLFVIAAVKGMWKLAVTGIAAGLVTSLVVAWAYPALVQTFKVTPNAVEMESPYIQRNIDATRTAYGLDEVETTNYTASTQAQAGQLRADAATTAQIRLLDPTIVSPTFDQLQQNRQYYKFADSLSVDRYNISGSERDTVIAVRELNLDGLDNAQRTWVNDHTVYTHGYGVAAAYGNTTTDRGAPEFYQRDIPSVGEMGDYEPRVYFGQRSPEYSIVGSSKGQNPWEIDYPDDSAANGQVFTTYKGDGGPKLSNMWEKLVYAIKFRSTDLFFSDRVTPDSQILYDRDPQERVAKVAPYLTLDSRAYPAVVDMDGNPDTPKRLVWIVDGYTTSNNYPYSARTSLSSAITDSLTSGRNQFGRVDEVNYVRNSVKAVVDAYSGAVTLYQWDEKDPIVQAWSKIFPGSLTSVKEMSGDLMAHVRYPEDLFKVQRTLLTKYHVTDAAAFYSGGDFWNVPNEPTEKTTANSGSTTLQPPYYLTLQMPGQDSAQFSLTSGFVPGGTTKRNVMTGFLAVDSNAGNTAGEIREGYGKLRLLELPRDSTVPGPGQAQNNFLTDSAVSRTLNLLDQVGTTVTRGNLLTLPVGGGLLYVQPVYVSASSGTQYPLVQYVLTAFGDDNKIGFAPTLDEALNQTFGGDSGASAGDADIEKDTDISGEDPTDASGSAGAKDEDKKEENAKDSSDGSSADSPSASADNASAQERLNSSLAAAKEALDASRTAMSNNDWAAYGTAQKQLEEALNKALQAQKELEGK